MSAPQILCLGEPLVEFNQTPEGLFAMGFGGDVSNVAIAAARHGARAGMVTRVGTDPFGAALCDLWAREGVDAAHVIRAAGEETGVYFVTHDAEGHHFTYRRKGSAASKLTPVNLPTDALSQAQVFYASGIGLAISDTMRAAVAEAAQITRAAGGLYAFDPNLRLALWSLEQARAVTHSAMQSADIALPGLDDARQLTGLQTPEEIAAFYHDLGPSIVALTLGAEGVLISVKGEGLRLPGRKVEAKDATGAGDCFNGAFLAALTTGHDPFQAADLANMAAALSTTGYGAVAPIPTLSQTRAALNSAPRP
ncbi:sugar kinase [Arenibacterium sp. LLYu02]|uniref:sugar kinase n=1 Tax=Arenibacterium sp. LLYu02 TaxID=3404132 RepID=UPI003B20FB9E